MDCSPPGSSVHGDSPGKNTGMGCHALLQGMFPTKGSNPFCLHLLHWQAASLPPVPQPDPMYTISSVQSLSHVQLFATPWTLPIRLLCPCDSPGNNTGMGCHALLQGIFPTKESNPSLLCLLHWQECLYHQRHQGSLKVSLKRCKGPEFFP